jgi:cytochrome P450
MLSQIITSPPFLRFISGFLRTFFPVFKISGWAIISRAEDVKEVLTRDRDFTIAEINSSKMQDVDIDFFLGMDASERHDNEKGVMDAIIKHQDVHVIRHLVKSRTSALLDALIENKIDVVGTLSRVVPLVIVEDYFGVPVKYKTKMQQWLRHLFHHLFLNLTNDEKVGMLASQSALELKTYMIEVIAEQKAKFKTGSLQSDTLMHRLLALQATTPTITDDYIRRNLCGLMIGAVDTTSKCVVLILEELFRRPHILAIAKNADAAKLKSICYEALRFNPHNPIVVRFARQAVRFGKQSQYRLKPNTRIAASIFSAMHDKVEFPDPAKFNWQRPNEYMHFGYGLHACFGRYINAVQIPEIIGGLVQLKNIRKADVNKGRVVYDGPFPDSFWVEFD